MGRAPRGGGGGARSSTRAVGAVGAYAVVVAAIALAAAGCAGAFAGRGDDDPVPPFELRPTAWRLVLERHPDLARDRARASADKTLAAAMAAFYDVVTDRDEPRDAKAKAARARACGKAWSLLGQKSPRTNELREQLNLARAYLAAECGLAKKAIAPLERQVKGRASADFVFYASHFWIAESLLALDRGEAAITHYRWILGEIESPLYPLATLRVAHCHWDDGRAAEAREYLGHVRDWIGDKTSPVWVRSLDRRVRDDLHAFSE